MQDTELSGNSGSYGGAISLLASIATQSGGEISDNTSAYGAAVYMNSYATYACDGSSSAASITANTATSRGGAFYGSSGSLTVTQCDLGTGTSDNSPSDVSWAANTYSYGSSASFTCSGSSCY